MGQPTRRFKAGACIATLFHNKKAADGEQFSLASVSLQRVYKDQSGQFQYATSFRPNDIPKAILVLNRAYEYVLLEEKELEPSQ